MHKGYKFLEPKSGRVYISQDVVFDKIVFPFVDLHPNVGVLLRKDILLLPNPSLHTEDVSCADQLSINPNDELEAVPQVVTEHQQQIPVAYELFPVVVASSRENDPTTAENLGGGPKMICVQVCHPDLSPNLRKMQQQGQIFLVPL